MPTNPSTLTKFPLKRRLKDFFAVGSTYLFSSFTLVALVAILVFIFSKGWSTLTWNFISGNYEPQVWTLKSSETIAQSTNTFTHTPEEDEYFSTTWGIGFTQSKSNEGLPITEVSYVDPKANINSWVDSTKNTPFTLEEGAVLSSALLWTTSDAATAEAVVPDVSDAKKVQEAFDSCTYMKSLTLSEGGQGMRGSLISTLYLILITMAIALPLGVGGAIYLAIYSKDNKGTRILRSLIDMITGIPSIIFGLVGGIVFLPLTAGKTSLIAGSLTLACMILPIIVKSTEESIKTIPHGMELSSLALGASQTQTTFKVILPNALPGILTATLLGIGRVIGESAALVYTAGVAIQDYIIPTRGSASLAVHIWYLMSGEHQNFQASCAISIVILFVILILSVLIKLISFKVNQAQKGK
jgi:phosphate transport system permease protein